MDTELHHSWHVVAGLINDERMLSLNVHEWIARWRDRIPEECLFEVYSYLDARKQNYGLKEKAMDELEKLIEEV